MSIEFHISNGSTARVTTKPLERITVGSGATMTGTVSTKRQRPPARNYVRQAAHPSRASRKQKAGAHPRPGKGGRLSRADCDLLGDEKVRPWHGPDEKLVWTNFSVLKLR